MLKVLPQRKREKYNTFSIYRAYLYRKIKYNPLNSLCVNIPNVQSKQSIIYDDKSRLQALALAEYEIITKIIIAITKISRQTITYLQKQARNREYNLEQSKKLLLSYIIDILRSGRPPIIIFKVKSTILKAI